MKKKKYRSKFEAKVAEFLRTKKVPFEYESIKLDYQLVHIYKPDFILKNGIIIETKGRFLGKDRTKLRMVKYYHPNKDIRLCFMRDNYLYKGSTTKYSDWCKTHNFKYCIERIPDSWLKEKSK